MKFRKKSENLKIIYPEKFVPNFFNEKNPWSFPEFAAKILSLNRGTP